MWTRRRFLARTSLSVLPLFSCSDRNSIRFEPDAESSCSAEDAPCDAPERAGPLVEFAHGVASGDPLAEAVVLWTRITPVSAGRSAEVEVHWVVASEPGLQEPIAEGVAATSADRDYTVKVDVSGLTPGATYYYRFRCGKVSSALGRTCTLPVGRTARLRLAAVSCANYPIGLFHVYRAVAERTDIDLVIHLGDYLYEYGGETYGDRVVPGRLPIPNREAFSLDDYRLRHAQYKEDPDLQEVHRQHPFAAIWDDHEVANNAHQNGARNHQPEQEGSWLSRKQAAVQAYFEWMPVREPPDASGTLYRVLKLGDLADLLLLDTRLVGRDPPPNDRCDATAVGDPARSLLGDTQEAWLEAEMLASQARGTRWRLIGQQVPMAQFPLQGGCLASDDGWDAYPANRERFLRTLEREPIENVVVITGDTHASYAMDLSLDPYDASVYDPDSGRGSLAVELLVPGVTSAAMTDPVRARRSEKAAREASPHIKFTEFHRRGYVLLDVDRERVRSEWHLVSSVLERVVPEFAGGVEVASGESFLRPLS